MDKILILIALIFIVYYRTLRYKYVSDDIETAKNPKKYKNILHKIWLMVFEVEKYHIQVDHFITILLHTAVCIMIYIAFGMNNISFIAALLFSINPINNQGSIWISGRGYVVPALFILIAMSVPIYLAIPSLIIAGKFLIGYYGSLVFLGSPLFYLILALPIIMVFNTKNFNRCVSDKINADTIIEDRKIHFRKFILAIKTYGFYLTLCLIPFRISFLHSFLQSSSGNDIMQKRAYTMKDKFFWIGLTAIVSGIIYSCLHWDIISYGWLWFSISIAPFCNLIRLQQEIAERYAYFPCIGIMIALSNILVSYPIITALFFGYYLATLNNIMEMYLDDYWLVEYAALNDKKSWFAWHLKALKRFEVGAFKEALNLFVMAYMLSPKEFKLLINIAICLKIAKRDKEAEDFLQKAEKNILPGQEKISKEVIDDFRKGKLGLLK